MKPKQTHIFEEKKNPTTHKIKQRRQERDIYAYRPIFGFVIVHVYIICNYYLKSA